MSAQKMNWPTLIVYVGYSAKWLFSKFKSSKKELIVLE